MITRQSILGMIRPGAASEDQRQHWETVAENVNGMDSHNLYRNEHIILIAPLLLCHDGFVIAANPLSQDDINNLEAFKKTWTSGQTKPFALIEKLSLSCSLIIHAHESLILVRDRLGLDNLFYTDNSSQTNEAFVFSSELNLLLEYSGEKQRKIDSRSVCNHLLYGRPRAGDSLFKCIKCLEPAHFTTIQQNKKTNSRYWSPRQAPLALDSRESRLQALEATLDQACRRSLSDQGNAIFLSGGLDSSYIAYIAAQNHRDNSCCYTITYTDKQFSDETHYARIISEHYKLPLKTVALDSEKVLNYLQQVLEEPQALSAWASICNYALTDAAIADGNTNILSGLGSDEVLANYDKALDYYFRVRESINHGNTGDIDLLQHITEVDQFMFPGVADFFSRENLQQQLLSAHNTQFAVDDLREFYSQCGPVNQHTHLFSHMVSHECHHRIPDLLIRNFNHYPQMQGANIVYPFLDAKFVEAACSLYPQERFLYENNKWRSKVSLKFIVADKFPKAILQRKRGTFDFPFKAWLKQQEFHNFVREHLQQSTIWQAGIFQPTCLNTYLDYMQRNKKNQPIDNQSWANELWVLFTLSAWYKKYIA